MASTITADTGAVSGTAGLKQSADSSGILALATGTGTTAVTIDASQNVGIGTSSPSTYGKFTSAVSANLDGVAVVYQTAPDGINGGALNFWAANNSTYVKQAYIQTVCTGGAVGSENSMIKFANFSLGTLAERARLDASGNLLIGTTTNTTGRIQSYALTNDSFECVAQDGVASSDFGIGWSITNNGQRFARIRGSYQSSAVSGGGYLIFQTKSTGSALADRLTIYDNGTIAFNAYGAGTLTTNSAGVISASDGRYKTKTRGVEDALGSIMALQPTYYRWNEDCQFHTEHEELGFIAQEVGAVIPAASPNEEEADKYKNYSDRAVIAVMVKAIQEQQALITTLTERITALEGAQA